MVGPERERFAEPPYAVGTAHVRRDRCAECELSGVIRARPPRVGSEGNVDGGWHPGCSTGVGDPEVDQADRYGLDIDAEDM